MSTFNLPDLGEGLAEAEIIEWHVKPGDRVEVDQPMVSVETAKSVVEVPVPCAGTVAALRGRVGDVIATGAPLIDFDAGTVVGMMPVETDDGLLNGRSAQPLGDDAPRSRAARREQPRALPLARALARRAGLDLTEIQGSGESGTVRLDDVLARLRSQPLDFTPQTLKIPPGSIPEPLRGARRVMAQAMSSARSQVALTTVCDDADIHGWYVRGDYMPRLMRALVAACRAEPALNAWYDAATQSRILFDRIDLAVAMDTPDGLIVPVLRGIERQSAEQLRESVNTFKQAAHNRETTPQDLRDFTFALSNFGTLAGRYGIPLVVPPTVAILGAGKAREEPIVRDGAVMAGRRIPLSLSFDHRCVTGGEACRFLAAVIDDLQKRD